MSKNVFHYIATMDGKNVPCYSILYILSRLDSGPDPILYFTSLFP